MRLLVDANLSPKIAAMFRDGGHDAVHVAGIGMLGASDEAILAHARDSGQVIVSADTDFGELREITRSGWPPRRCLTGWDRPAHPAPRPALGASVRPTWR